MTATVSTASTIAASATATTVAAGATTATAGSLTSFFQLGPNRTAGNGDVLFQNLLNTLREQVTTQLAQVRPMSEEERQALQEQVLRQQQAVLAAAKAAQAGQVAAGDQEASADGFDENDPSTWGNPGRNDACPCGSGKKFKHCHGKA